MQSNTFQLVLGALVAGLLGTGVWAYQGPPGLDPALMRHGVMMAER